MYKPDGTAIAFSGSRTEDALVAFVADPKPPPPPPPPPERTPFTEDGDGDVVLVAGEKEFSDLLDTADSNVMVMFYAPWCGHCKKLKAPYKAAAARTKAAGTGVLAAVDCTIDGGLCRKHDVSGYPTLKVYKPDGTAIAFSGSRTEDALVAFVADPKPPPPPPPPPGRTPFTEDGDGDVILIKGEDGFSSLVDDEAGAMPVMVMYYAPFCGHCQRFKPAYSAAATKAKETKTGILAAVDCTVDKRVCKEAKVSGYPTVKVYVGGMDLDYAGARTESALLDFLSSYAPRDVEDAHDEL